MRDALEHRKKFSRTLSDTAPLELLCNVRRYSTTDNMEQYYYENTQIMSIFELRILSRVTESNQLIDEIERVLQFEFRAQKVKRPYELID